MLTRAQVAERLGKSIATVRRLERAGELRPSRDWRGVHHFHAYEVEELIVRYASGEQITAARDASLVRASGRNASTKAAESPARFQNRVAPSMARANEGELAELRSENSELRERLAIVRVAVGLMLDHQAVEEALELLVTAL